MRTELPAIEAPEWLNAISNGRHHTVLPIENILVDSLYYPGCGLNGTPVKFLAGNVCSFVYADYGMHEQTFLSNLNGNGPNCGFLGYKSILQREIHRGDIVPNGWSPPIIPQQERQIRRLKEQEQRCQPFGHWSVWQRKPEYSESTGPYVFSFLFLGGEMSAVYQGLYCRLSIAPKILAIIQPGALGGEWEHAGADDSFFKTVVKSNRAGLPEYLIYGGYGRGFYEVPCWSEYQGTRLVQLPERYAGIWRLNRKHATATTID
jgi:hypothetical protein